MSKRLRKFVGLGSLILIVAGVTLWYLAPTLGPLSVLFGAAGLIYWAMASVLARIAGVVAEVCHRPGGIDQNDVARGDPQSVIVLDHR